VLIGLMLHVAGYFVTLKQYGGPVLIAGISFVCAGTAGMVGIEAHRFGYREGWLIMPFEFPIIVLANFRTARTESLIPSASQSCSSLAALSRWEEAQTETFINIYHQCLLYTNGKTEHRKQLTDHKP